jgi:hypothetical protein
MPGPIFLILALAFGALGFFAGASLLGGAQKLRGRPRYLMTGGALFLIGGLILGRSLIAETLLYFPVIFLMMTGIGMALAGWDSEKDLQDDHEEVHELRMREIRRQLRSRQTPDLQSSRTGENGGSNGFGENDPENR